MRDEKDVGVTFAEEKTLVGAALAVRGKDNRGQGRSHCAPSPSAREC
jgi:hypothetical protein